MLIHFPHLAWVQRECQKAERMSKGMGHSTQMDYTNVVPSSSPACSSTTQRDMQHTTNTSEKKEYSLLKPQVKTSSSSMLQWHQREKDYSEQATKMLSAAWRKNTKNKYEGAIKRYVNIFQERKAYPCNSNNNMVTEFLTQEFERDLSSSAINGMITAIKR